MSKHTGRLLPLPLLITFLITTTVAFAQGSKSAEQTKSTEDKIHSEISVALGSGDKNNETNGGNDASVATDPLVRLMVSKGILTAEEARAIAMGRTVDEQRNRLLVLMRDKGLLSPAEFASLNQATPGKTAIAENATGAAVSSTPQPVAPGNSSPTQAQSTEPKVIAAIAPIRLLQVDPPKREGIIPDIKLGTGARLKLYGFFKTSIIHDSSSPQGNDFPLPLLAADTGPNGSPEFHLKARALRLGANFEWLDAAPNIIITGKLEFDFEGDFARANNRNISSIRSSQASLRLAWGRIDRVFSEKLTGFALFGQDWTPFVSSTLPNMIENTNFGGVGFGAAYERLPQARFGFNYNVGGSRSLKLQPEVAIVLPAFGNLPTNVADQLGFGERQGADSERPGIQGRFVTQWQLEKANGVAPAQFIVSFEQARREAIVTAANVPTAFKTAFPGGAVVASNSIGYSVELQLPTHFVTLAGKYYSGSDLRFFLAGQLLSNFNDTTGLTNTATVASIDGSSNVVFGLLNGVPTVAPQRPVRAQGGFMQLGFPLSRIFGANPEGRSAGWTALLYYGFDQANSRDARQFSPVRGKSDLFSGNVQYKLNSFITLAFEQGLYRTRVANTSVLNSGGLPLFRGLPGSTAHDVRSEFATIFTF